MLCMQHGIGHLWPISMHLMLLARSRRNYESLLISLLNDHAPVMCSLCFPGGYSQSLVIPPWHNSRSIDKGTKMYISN
jgi:hypothetical protein